MSQYYQVNLSELLDLQNVHFVTQSQSQESQPILMTAHDQSEQLIVQEDPNQHIVYSPNKQNETQYVIQQTEDQSSLQDLQESFVQQQQQQVQSQPTQQTAQSVYYSSSAEVQQSQPVYLNQNLIQSPQQYVFQQSPQAKVVIQRNPDMGQLNTIQYQPGQQTTQMTYEQHNQMIQNQMQQQQQQAQQLVSPQFIQLQQIQQAQHNSQTQLVDRQKLTGHVLRIIQHPNQNTIFRQNPQQQILTQSGQIQQIAAQQNQGPRLYLTTTTASPRVAIQNQPRFRAPLTYQQNNIRISSPQQQQITIEQQQTPPSQIQQQITRIRTPRPRIPNPTVAKRIVTSQVVNPQAIQNSARFVIRTASPNILPIGQPSPARLQNHNTVAAYPHSMMNQQQSQQPQMIRAPMHSKIIQIQQQQATQVSSPQQVVAVKKEEKAEKSQVNNSSQEQPATTTTLPKKEGLNGIDDDLEDSIQATVVSRASNASGTPQPSNSPPPLVHTQQPHMQKDGSNMEEQKRKFQNQQQLQQQHDLSQHHQQMQQVQTPPPPIGVVRPMVKGGQAPQMVQRVGNQMFRRVPQVQPQQQMPAAQTQQQHRVMEIAAREQESSKMLVILDSGEQRLITFTLPRKTCTVMELLEQVNIRVDRDSDIECIANPGGKIDYIVKVGQSKTDHIAMKNAAENAMRQRQMQQQQQQQSNQIIPQSHVPQRTMVQKSLPQAQQNTVPKTCTTTAASTSSPGSTSNNKTQEVAKLPEPKYMAGYMAVCAACGATGFDHAKCERCHRVFNETPKSIKVTHEAISGNQKVVTSTTIIKTTESNKKDQIEAIQKRHQINFAEQQRKSLNNSSTGTPPVRGRGTSLRGRGRGRGKVEEPVIVTLSSDDEAEASDSNQSKASSANQSVNKDTLTNPLSFEPVIQQDTVSDDFLHDDVTILSPEESKLRVDISCRTIRIGSLRFDPVVKQKVIVTPKGIKISAPVLKSSGMYRELDIQMSEIVKLIYHSSNNLHVVFIYTKPSCGNYVRSKLDMTGDGKDNKTAYYHPLSLNETQKRIILLMDHFTDEYKSTMASIFKKPILEEIQPRDANELLMRSTGAQPNVQTAVNAVAASEPGSPTDERKKLLLYPPGRGGYTINVGDYLCLAADIYLNDVIIDFYFKYLELEVLSEEQRNRTTFFTTFFYKRLTLMQQKTRPEKDAVKLTASQKRHLRVTKWTKNVNIFEKDFIIIPINEQSHWFLVIICYPYLNEPHTIGTNQPIKLAPAAKRKKKKSMVIGNTTITPLSKKEAVLDSINLNEDDASERDEAEAEDTDLGSDMDSEEDVAVDRGQAVKLPCILIFDSLSGSSRTRVVATLRDYLTCEYKAKYPDRPPKVFNKNNMYANCVKVPQQNNFTDCGLFVLHYVEEFFRNPIKDFRIPIKHLHNWFDHFIVTKKREDIANLIKELMAKHNPEIDVVLPEIDFPTKDGKLLDVEDSFEEAFHEDEFEPDPNEMETASSAGASSSVQIKEHASKATPNTSQGEVKGTTRYIKKRSLEANGSSDDANSSKTPKISEN